MSTVLRFAGIALQNVKTFSSQFKVLRRPLLPPTRTYGFTFPALERTYACGGCGGGGAKTQAKASGSTSKKTSKETSKKASKESKAPSQAKTGGKTKKKCPPKVKKEEKKKSVCKEKKWTAKCR